MQNGQKEKDGAPRLSYGVSSHVPSCKAIKELSVTLKQVLFSFDGRISRSTFWVRGLLPLYSVVGAGALIDLGISGHIGLFYLLSSLVTLWSGLDIFAKRCHD